MRPSLLNGFFVALIASLITCPTGTAIAKQSNALFRDSLKPAVESVHGVVAQSARINKSLLVRAVESIEIALPDGTSTTAYLMDFERRGRGNFTWRGSTDINSAVINVTLTLQQGYVVGSIDMPAAVFEIRPVRGAGALHMIELLDLESFDEGPEPDAVAAPFENNAAPVAADLASDEIHLLSVYSPQAESAAGGTAQIEASIQAAVDVSNTAFMNSSMDARFVLVHSTGVARDDTGDASMDLTWVRTDANVTSLRNQYGADLVSLITETGGCGLGYVLQSLVGSPNYAFQVTRRDCLVGNKTLTHEHGHNMGFAHNPLNASVTGIFNDSHGHWVDGEFRTIMSYSNQCTGFCPRVLNFSDPSVLVQGFASGISNERNNASTGRLSAPVVAAYRPAVIVGNTQLVQVLGSNDDAEESASNGAMSLTSSDIELGNDPGTNGNQTEGLRFNNLAIRQGANITQAYLTFTVDEIDTVSTIVDIHAQDVDNAAVFTGSTNNITNRALTTAKVTWDIPAWNAIDQQQSSPDLSALVQEVVDRPGWTANNSMVFIIFGSGSRTAESYDGSPAEAARLFVVYDTAPPSNQPPVADFAYNCSGPVCDFNDLSTDSDGSIVSWSWDFDDGNGSSLQNPGHTYLTQATLSVSLTVTDDDGDSDISIQNVSIGQQITRGPYLQTLTQDSVIVRWRTGFATESVVRYGTSSGSLTSTASVAGPVTEHAVTLTGLSDLTQYFYSIGDTGGALAGDSSYHFNTAPIPGTAVATRFWVIGDSGTANSSAFAVRDAYKSYTAGQPSNFMLMLGDNAYNDGTDAEYQAAVFDTYPELLRQLPVWVTLGNHDGHSTDSVAQTGPYYDIFDMPPNAEAGGLPSGTEAYYSFDYGNIHFVVLESYQTDRSVGGTMMTWLEADLVINNKPWVIAFWHHPPYTMGSHNSDSETQLIEMRQNALPLLEEWGVDLVLSGHSHSYERSMLIDGHYGVSTSLDIATMIVDVGDGKIGGFGAYGKPKGVANPHAGTVYAVAGSSGKTSGVDAGWPHPVMVSYRQELGSMVVDVNGDQLDAVFIDSGGTVRDEFTILKLADVVAPLIIDASAEDATHVLVNFNERLDVSSAETVANYVIGGLSVSAAELLSENKSVRLTTSSMNVGSAYILTVNNVLDDDANSIAPDSTANFNYVPMTTTTFQDGVSSYSGTFDASLLSGSPDVAQGAEIDLEVDGSSAKHTLIGWDISTVPSTAIIETASIHLTVFDVSTGNFGCNAMIRNWVENDVTWNNADTNTSWQTAGATGASDRKAEVLCGFGANSTGGLVIDLNAAGIAQVQRWVDGTDPNYGLMLGNPTNSDGFDAYSSEYGTPASRPKFEISYSLAATPCSAARTMPAEQWVFFSLPCMPANASARTIFFDGPAFADYDIRWVLYSYDSAAKAYVHVDADDALVEGRGYLFYTLDSFAAAEVRGAFNNGDPYPLVATADPGSWNLVGNPHNATVMWTDVKVDDGVSSYGWAGMDPSGNLYACEALPVVDSDCTLWHVMNKLEGGGGTYIPYDGFTAAPGSLDAFDAMWVRSHRAQSITIVKPAAVFPQVAKSPSKTSMDVGLPSATEIAVFGIAAPEASGSKKAYTEKAKASKNKNQVPWEVRLIAESGSYRDDGNWFGRAKDAKDGLDSRDLEEWLPYGNPYVTILFTNPNFDTVEWGYTRDYRKLKSRSKGSWSFIVRASDDVSEVTLSWEGDLSQLKKAYLKDEISGKKTKLVAGGKYTFNISEGEHPFRIVVK